MGARADWCPFAVRREQGASVLQAQIKHIIRNSRQRLRPVGSEDAGNG